MKRIVAMILAAGILTAAVPACALAAEAAALEDYAPLGLLTESGYENTYFGFRCEAPSEYTLDSRGIFIASEAQDRAAVAEASNSESALSLLKSQLMFGYVTVFSAASDADCIAVGVQSPGIGYDKWEEEENVVDNSIGQTYENLESAGTEDVAIADIRIEKTQFTVMDELHWGMTYSCTMNGVPYYGNSVFMISEDNQYLITFEVTSFDAQKADVMLGYFQKI